MEKFFSLDWFKAKMESAVERQLDERIGRKLDALLGEEPVEKQAPTPYVSLKLVNDTLTVVFGDGSIFSKPNANEIDFVRVQSCTSKEEVLFVIQDNLVAQEKHEEYAEQERVENIHKGFEMLGELRDFTVAGNCVYFTGTNRTLPELLINKFMEVVGKYDDLESIIDVEASLILDEEYQSLKNFFMWCCLNPRAEVADDLYRFLVDNSFRITKQGFFVALRNVVTVSPQTDNTLLQFVSNAYNKVKAVWKKNPNDYVVTQKHGGSYVLRPISSKTPEEEKLVGALTALYKDMPNMNENRFTDAHTRTFDIRVGKVVNMPMEDCNWSRADCAHAGLHFTSNEIHYVGCGDTSVLVLINPMKVVGIGSYKGRCYEYLPIMTVPRVEATRLLHDIAFDTLQLDEDYAIHELEELEARAKEGFTKESSKYDFNLPNLSSVELNRIVKNLEGMKETISKRVSLLD